MSSRPMRGQAGARDVRLGVVALCLVQFVDVLGVTVVVTALPSMLADFRASAEAGSLIATGYAMFFGGLLMLGARLGDRFGHRRITLAGLGIFAVAAVVGATAPSVLILTVARCLQGAAAALSVASALRLLTTITVEGRQRDQAIALWSAAGAAAGASGFVVGGTITELAGWRLVFWTYLPLAIALAATIALTVPSDTDHPPSVRLNLPGAAAFTAAVMLFVVATNLLPQPGRADIGTGLLATSVAAAALFVVVDRQAAAPLLPRRVLGAQTVRQGALAGLLNTATTSSAITLTTLYLQNTRGLGALAAAMLLLPFSLAVIAGSALAAPAMARWRPQRVIALGLTAIAVSDAALIPAVSKMWALPISVAIGGAGIALSSVAATGLGTSVPAAARGTASGIINTAAQLGTAIGIAVLLLVADVTTGAPDPGTPIPVVAWGLAALISLCGAAAFARSTGSGQPPRSRRARSSAPAPERTPAPSERTTATR